MARVFLDSDLKSVEALPNRIKALEAKVEALERKLVKVIFEQDEIIESHLELIFGKGGQ